MGNSLTRRREGVIRSPEDAKAEFGHTVAGVCRRTKMQSGQWYGMWVRGCAGYILVEGGARMVWITWYAGMLS